MNMNQKTRDKVRMGISILWIGTMLAAFSCAGKAKAAEPMFTLPASAFDPKDKEIRWYSSIETPGIYTANHERFDDTANTFASRDLPFDTRIKVTYNGRVAYYRCNDRGPNHVELTAGGFLRLEQLEVGVIRGAKIEIETI